MKVSDKKIHIISFDIPYPPNYGGVIDVYYKIKELHKRGVGVILHCYEYGRDRSKELEDLCAEVNYYPRKLGRQNLFKKNPYIVVSRNSDELLQRLIQDDYPIVFEGLHSCYYLSHEHLQNRLKVVRTHNIEHDYYRNLAEAENSIFKRYYFYNEANKLERFEQVLEHADHIACISKPDQAYFDRKYGHTSLVSAFHPFQNVESGSVEIEHAVYHGNLSVPENNKAALWLVQEVFNDLEIPLVIAGNDPSAELIQAVESSDHVSLKANCTTEEIHELVQTAKINVLPTFQATGIKLKLLAALYMGRFCVVNTPMIQDTGLERLCHIADSPIEMKKVLRELMVADYEENSFREQILNTCFTNERSSEALMSLLFEDQKQLHLHTLEYAKEICE
jgi:hypothetical protein